MRIDEIFAKEEKFRTFSHKKKTQMDGLGYANFTGFYWRILRKLLLYRFIIDGQLSFFKLLFFVFEIPSKYSIFTNFTPLPSICSLLWASAINCSATYFHNTSLSHYNYLAMYSCCALFWNLLLDYYFISITQR